MRTERRSDRRLWWAIRSTVLSFGSLSVSIARSELAPEEREPRSRRDRRSEGTILKVRGGYNEPSRSMSDEGLGIGLIARQSISIARPETGLSSWLATQEMSHACKHVPRDATEWKIREMVNLLDFAREYSEGIDLPVEDGWRMLRSPPTYQSCILRSGVRVFFCRWKERRQDVCEIFPPLSTVKSAEASRVRNCSFVRIAISPPALSTGKHVTLSRRVFQTFFSVYMAKNSNLILGWIDRSVHVYDWKTLRNAKATWC